MYDETLANTSKQSTQQRGKKKEQREKTEVQAQRTKSKVGHKRAKEQIISEAPTSCMKHIRKKNG
jgi:HJR/Mrr/RecB family endonuclease